MYNLLSYLESSVIIAYNHRILILFSLHIALDLKVKCAFAANLANAHLLTMTRILLNMFQRTSLHKLLRNAQQNLGLIHRRGMLL